MIDKVYIKQGGVETPSFETIDEQYELAHKLAEIADNVSEDSYIEAKVSIPFCSPSDKEKVNGRFGEVIKNDERFVQFEDNETRKIVVSKYDNDSNGGVTLAEIQSVKGNVAFGDLVFTLFDEFMYFTGLTALDGNVNGSNTYAFNNCSSLRSIALPSSIVGIGSWAFGGCTSLERIRNIEQVTRLSQYAFSNTPALGIEVSLPNLTSIAAAAFSRSGVTKILNLGNITSTPAGSNHISGYSIGVFGSCPNLESIVLPSALTSLGGYAANKCPNLRSVDFNHAACSIGSNSFQNDTSLREVKNSENVTTIGSNAFAGAGDGTLEVSFPGLATLNGSNRPFYQSGVKKILNLGSIETIPSSTSASNYFAGDSKYLDEVHFPITLKTIGDSAFRGCSSLKTIVGGDNIETIGAYSFYGCPLEGSYSFPKCTLIGVAAFRNAGDFEITKLGDGCVIDSTTSGSVEAFGSSKVRRVNLEGVVTVRSGAFRNCASLVNVDSFSTINYIGPLSFSGTTSLNIVVDAPNLETLGQAAFYNSGIVGVKNLGSITSMTGNSSGSVQTFGACRNLKYIILPETLASMGVAEFVNNTALTTMIFKNHTPISIGSSTLNANSKFKIYVPSGSLSSYQTASVWSSYASRTREFEEVDSLPSDADTSKGYLTSGSFCYYNGTNWIAISLATGEETTIYDKLDAANWLKYDDNEINIGPILSNPHDKIEYEFTTSGMSNAGHIYSSNVSNCGVWNDGYKLYFRFAESGSAVTPFQANTAGGRTIISVANSESMSSWTVDVISKGTHYEGTNDYALSPIDSDMCLFGQRKSSSDVNLGHGSFHSLKICNGNLVLHHFMPSMNEGGMKGVVDLVTGEFFYNENNQELLTIS